MELYEITTRLKRYREIAKVTEEPDVFNRCKNQICVLEIMLERWTADQVAHTGRWYDRDSDFHVAFENVVEELIENMEQGVI